MSYLCISMGIEREYLKLYQQHVGRCMSVYTNIYICIYICRHLVTCTIYVYLCSMYYVYLCDSMIFYVLCNVLCAWREHYISYEIIFLHVCFSCANLWSSSPITLWLSMHPSGHSWADRSSANLEPLCQSRLLRQPRLFHHSGLQPKAPTLFPQSSGGPTGPA